MDTQKYASRPVGTLHCPGGAASRPPVRAVPFRSWRRAAVPARALSLLPAFATSLVAAGAASGVPGALVAGSLLACAGALMLMLSYPQSGADRGKPTASWTGQICPIMLTDITAFSAPGRNDEDRLNLRRTMYDMLQRAFEAAGLPWQDLHKEDRGDGALIVIPPDTPATAVAAHVLGHLAAALRQHNQSARDALRMQLRVALHAGPVTGDAQGVTGNAINQTARLVQARILRKYLDETHADLGVIVSAYIYDNVIRQHGSQPTGAADYRKIRFQVKESALTAWIRLTGALADDQAERVSSRIAAEPPGHRLAFGAGPGREVLADGRLARAGHAAGA